MSRYIIYILICSLIAEICFSQQSQDLIIGSWVKTDANYYSGKSLPINHALNQSYLRIVFQNDGKAFKTIEPLENGYLFDYLVIGPNLKIGFVKYYIEKVTNDSLIIIEEGQNGNKESGIRIKFIDEEKYQGSLPLKTENLILIRDDTIYIENEKIRADFNKNEPFKEFLRKNISEYENFGSSKNYFMATFLIDSKGHIDSIKIHKGNNNRFNKQFVKAVRKSSKYWNPAIYNNKNVAVLRTVEFKFISYKSFEIELLNYHKGILEMQKNNFNKAIYYFNIVLEKNPNESDALYNKGCCLFKLGKNEEACVELHKLRELKSKKADQLIEKICN